MVIPQSTRVRYIKLGRGGSWEKECIKDGIIRFGFGSANDDRFPLCRAGRWVELKQSFLAAGDLAGQATQGQATRFTNETRLFFEDDGTTLWITFVGENLYWGFLSPTEAEKHRDGHGVWRIVSDGWRATDINGEPLTKDRLSGALTKLAAYRGTSCNVDKADYIIRRINGQKIPEVERALSSVEQMKASILELMHLLEPQDFEILVDLVFSTSGWRRQGVVGKTQKTIDIDLILPSTGERAFVQVKSKTTIADLQEYIARIDEIAPYDRMFFVYHSGNAETDDDRVTLVGPERLAELVLDAGLTNWLIRKVS